MSAQAGGILSEEITMSMCVIPSSGSSGAVITDPSSWTQTNLAALFPASSGSQVALTQLQSIPSLGGAPSKIDVTCLEHKSKHYINGLIDYGDSVDFKFLYDNTPTTGNFALLNSATYKNVHTAFEIKFKTGEKFYFVGDETPVLDEVAVDAAITFTMSTALQTEIFYAGIQ